MKIPAKISQVLTGGTALGPFTQFVLDVYTQGESNAPDSLTVEGGTKIDTTPTPPVVSTFLLDSGEQVVVGDRLLIEITKA